MDTDMMERGEFAVCVTVLVCLSSFSAAIKTHDLMLIRADKPTVLDSYMPKYEMRLKKVDKNNKEFSLIFDFKEDFDSDYLCEVKIFQKTNGNYIKAPVEIGKKSCCEFIEENKLVYPCIHKHSSFPDKCPIPKGSHWIKDYNVDSCNYTQNLPPNLPEEYKTELYISRGPIQLYKQVYYAKLKRVMSFY